MQLKYETNIKRLSCNLSRFEKRDNRDAYCWVFEDITNPINFIPRAITIGRDECTSWALSFFETKNQAKNRMKTLLRKNSNLHKKLGTHIANGQLQKGDGISENCDPSGHFNHFEYSSVDFREKFTIIDYSYK